MLTLLFSSKSLVRFLTFFVLSVSCISVAVAQKSGVTVSGKELYNRIKTFSLTGGAADVSGLVLKRDRAVMIFNGTFYFAAPVEGRVTGAVFVGQGTFQAAVPPSEFEKNNVKRLLNSDSVQSDFKTAVLRFSDDTFDVIGKNKRDASPTEQAQKMASEIDGRMLRETGANLASRITLSIVNGENPGFFFANFDGGNLDRFSFFFDAQTRIPTAYFDINAGEKGLILAYKSLINANETLMAFHGLEDYQSGTVAYSDVNDLVDITDYKMDVDLRNPKNKLGLKTTVSMNARFPNLRAVPFFIGESLGEYEKQRLKKQMRLKSVRSGGEELEAVQEDWEGAVTVFLPKATAVNQKLELTFEFEGDFLRQPEFAIINKCFYPASNTTWYPRHGYLDRATYNFTYKHSKNLKVASVGMRQSEEPDAEDKESVVTRYAMKYPISLATFALGPFERHSEMLKLDDKSVTPIPLEFNSLPGGIAAIKEDFILAELNNSVRYFHALFGQYPYENFSATFHPYGFGQGFPSMLMIPSTDRANKFTYSFISHETAHQWWGNIVAWRSYRDQWLSEGFAEYSGVLYTSLRENPKAARKLVDYMRDSLKLPPQTVNGAGKGKLFEVGPIILGQRLNTTKTAGAYQTLIYNKGALVLRMLHFLMSNPVNGDDKAFYEMMKDFVERYRNRVASTDDFRMVANEHFVKTPIAQKYRLTDLNWFFRQWVYQTELPSYQLEYTFENQPDGSVILSGNVLQENATEKWLMPLPLILTLGENKFAGGTVIAYGPKTPFKIKLPTKPLKVELDPQRWVLSEKTSSD